MSQLQRGRRIIAVTIVFVAGWQFTYFFLVLRFPIVGALIQEICVGAFGIVLATLFSIWVVPGGGGRDDDDERATGDAPPGDGDANELERRLRVLVDGD